MELITDKTIREKVIHECLEEGKGLKMTSFVKCLNCKRIYKGKNLRVFSVLYLGETRYLVRCKNPKCSGSIFSIVDKDYDDSDIAGIFI